MKNWIVNVYNDVIPIASWEVKNKTEAEAIEETQIDIDIDYPECQWTITEIY